MSDNTGIAADRYTAVAIALHWMIAALILFNLAIGFFMESLPLPGRITVIGLHISSGISVLVLSVLRIVWRLLNPPPPFVPQGKAERYAAHFVHFALYFGMLAMPLLGWSIISSNPPPGSPGAAYAASIAPKSLQGGAASANAMKARGLPRIWGVVPLPMLAPLTKMGATPEGVAPQAHLHERFAFWHGVGGAVMIALLLLHVLGALKHQLIDRMPELARMGLGRSRRRS